ncbi:HAD-IC family P-type ATPase [Chitinimonas koreensis]|nr:HAD-IC family P-type ATPase [Chitinimonas koreensis]
MAAQLRGADALTAVLAGIALAMAILPHELPVIMTVFLALGARRMARAGVLTRHLQAIETLGRVTALCVDKTGTLTENRMAVAALQVGEARLDLDGPAPVGELPEDFHLLVEYAVLASARVPTDPMERAFHHLAERYLAGTEHLHPDWALIREYELTPALRAMSHGWSGDEAASRHPVAAKGAPEAIAALCHLPPAEAGQLMRHADAMAARGLRVLAVARAEQDGQDWPDDQHDFSFRLHGLIGLADPIRPEVPAAVARCREAGIAVYMITGDHPVTARAIAAQAGIDTDGVLTGSAIDGLDAAALARQLAATRVFARLDPQQKLRLVEALAARGEVVAMTGDGVNDAPALKAAHIGIAMGRRGTDVAREAASLVAVEDDFGAIAGAVAHGRRIYDNLARAVVYTLAVHLPTIALAFVPALLSLPPVLLPLHIAFLELVIGPACSIAFESEPGDAHTMRRRPRLRSERLLSPRAWRLALGAGAGAALWTLAGYAAILALGAGAEAARAAGFTAIVCANLGLILGVRSAGRPTPALAAVVGATLAALALVHAVPPLRTAFGFAPLSAAQAAIAALPLLPTWFGAVWLGRKDRGRIR